MKENASMEYSLNEVQLLVAQARALTTRQWVPGKDENPSALDEARRAFDSSLITPEIGSVEIEPHIAGILNVDPGMRQVWFVTASNTQRVFYDEETRAFGVAWGPDSATGNYVDLGFRTEDPIDAFLA